ncbi:MAG: hypothetical protein E7676_07075 [Ruminococcaceae bacterium]|nr:hypothetical protein [Oscillospiraceae bacterium]
MKKEKRPIDLYLPPLLLLGGGAVILRTVACFTEWNGTTMHFNNSMSITIANLLVVFTILLFTTYFLLTKKSDSFVASSDNSITYIPAGMVSVALLFLSIDKLVGLKNYYIASNPVLSALSVLIAVLGIGSVVSFFLTIFIQKNENAYKAAFNMAVVVLLAVYAAYLYFNKQTHPTNSPAKIVDMMAYLFTSIFFLFESRISLGRAFWRPYTVFGLTAALLTAYSSVPTIIYYAFGGSLISDSIYESALTLSLFIFITARMFLLRRISRDGACEAAKCIETLASLREKEIQERSSNTHAQEDNNAEEAVTEDFENYTMELPIAQTEADDMPAPEND